ncbi:hypothetical protein CO675_28930 [Bradyrhizobium sp. C9]|nr:hypothetical protein CO675_28930 [Bradyrhizobium sp. C9]
MQAARVQRGAVRDSLQALHAQNQRGVWDLQQAPAHIGRTLKMRPGFRPAFALSMDARVKPGHDLR